MPPHLESREIALETYAFIQVIVVAAVATIVILSLSVLVEVRLGIRAARLTLRLSLATFIAVVAGAVGVSRVTGEWAEFVARDGAGTLAEILAFFGTFIFIAYFMGSRHIAYKAALAARERD